MVRGEATPEEDSDAEVARSKIGPDLCRRIDAIGCPDNQLDYPPPPVVQDTQSWTSS